MKISAVGGYNLNLISNLNSKTKGAKKSNFDMQYNPISPELKSDKVSFTGTNPAIPFFLKLAENIPCPCCGIKMVRGNDVARKLDEKVLSGSSAKAIEALSAFEGNMHPTEKACFAEINELSKKNLSRPLNELLLMAKSSHLKKLKASEFKVLDKVDEIAKKLSLSSADKLTEITKTARKILRGEGPYVSFKRKTVLDGVFKLKAQIPEKDVADELLKASQELPSSGTDVDAFMVKYAGRGSKEIGQRLVSTSIGTVEHIKPKSLGGPDNDSNFMLECAGCNNPRGNQLFPDFVADNPGMIHNIPEGADLGDFSVQEWVKTHPEHRGNAQKSLDVIIEKINKGEVKGYNWYPAVLAQTLNKESKGALILDISNLEKNEEPPKSLKELVKKYNSKNQNFFTQFFKKPSTKASANINNAAEAGDSAKSKLVSPKPTIIKNSQKSVNIFSNDRLNKKKA